jgi:WD40 repeat protein
VGRDWGPLRPPYVLATFSEDENKIAIATDKGFSGVINRAAKTAHALFQSNDKISGLRFLGRDGAKIAAAVGSRVVIFDADDPSQHAQLPMRNPERVLAVGYATKRSTIVAITQDARVHSWLLGEEQIHLDASQSTKGRLRNAYLVDEAGTAAIVELEDGAIESWDLQSEVREPVLSASGETRLIDASFDRTGNSTLLASKDNVVRIWDRSAGGVFEHRLEIKDKTASAAIFRPHTHQVAIGYEDGSIEMRDPTQGQTIWQSGVAHKGHVRYLAFDQSGTRLISTSVDRTALVWSIEGNTQPIRLAGHTEPVDFAAFSPKGDLIVTGSSDSTFRLWNALDGAERNVLPVPESYLDPIHNASINAQAAFTSDGKLLVTVTSGDGYVIGQPALVWDVKSGKLLQALKHEGAAIWHIAITPDDRYVVTTSYDNSAALWDIHTGRRVQIFPGHPTAVLKAAVYDNGRLLATASGDGTLRIWQIDSGLLVHDLRVKSGLSNFDVSHNGRFIATGRDYENGAEVGIWDAIEGNQIVKIQEPNGPLSPLAGLSFAADDRSLLTRTQTGMLTVWSLPPLGQPLIDLAWQRVGRQGQELLTREQRVRFALEAP